MPRPARPWFRMYSNAVDNQKMHSLPDRVFKPWLFLLCLANENQPRGRLPALEKIAFKLRLSQPRAQAILDQLLTAGLVDREGEHYVMHEWDDWQADRDVSPSLRADKSRLNHANVTEQLRLAHAREREEEEEEEEETEERREDARAPDHPFAFAYARKYAERHAGRPPSPVEHGAALALEREYGADACLQVAGDLDWSKHPNYMRPILQERRTAPPPIAAAPARPSLIYEAREA